MRKLDQTETLVKIGDTTYVREVTETDFCDCMCLYFQFDSICIFSEFEYQVFSVSNLMLSRHRFCCYSYPNAGVGYTFYPLSILAGQRSAAGRAPDW